MQKFWHIRFDRINGIHMYFGLFAPFNYPMWYGHFLAKWPRYAAFHFISIGKNKRVMPQNHQIVLVDKWTHSQKEAFRKIAGEKKLKPSSNATVLLIWETWYVNFPFSLFSHFYSMIITVNHAVRRQAIVEWTENGIQCLALFNYVIVLSLSVCLLLVRCVRCGQNERSSVFKWIRCVSVYVCFGWNGSCLCIIHLDCGETTCSH